MHEDLLDEKWQDPDLRMEYAQRMMDVMRSWVPTKEVGALFEEAQARHAPYGRVLPPELLVENPQLEARDWWQQYQIDGTQTRGPGPPYRFARTPWRVAPPERGDDNEAPAPVNSVLNAIGWTE